jgi:hypothetical protein
LRLGDDFYAPAPRVNGLPVRSDFVTSSSGSQTGSFIPVGRPIDSDRDVLYYEAILITGDGIPVPANTGQNFSLRLSGRQFEARLGDPSLLNQPVRVRYQFTE